mmetsp:Transcript_12391/g.35985  ORF Transcript_12391/g.35985 Transcript_12391/m.35985 type:complete len:262 (+) Transcript_12391:1236-2021(+)
MPLNRAVPALHARDDRICRQLPMASGQERLQQHLRHSHATHLRWSRLEHVRPRSARCRQEGPRQLWRGRHGRQLAHLRRRLLGALLRPRRPSHQPAGRYRARTESRRRRHRLRVLLRGQPARFWLRPGRRGAVLHQDRDARAPSEVANGRRLPHHPHAHGYRHAARHRLFRHPEGNPRRRGLRDAAVLQRHHAPGVGWRDQFARRVPVDAAALHHHRDRDARRRRDQNPGRVLHRGLCRNGVQCERCTGGKGHARLGERAG